MICVAVAGFWLSCVHRPRLHTAVSFPQFARQCTDTREVVCLVDEDLSDYQCQNFIAPSVAAINAAAGREVLRYAGVTSRALAAELWKAGTYVIMGANLPPRGDGILLGLTTPTLDPNDTECIATVFTQLDRSVWTEPRVSPLTVVTHEMLHGLGYDHASPDSIYKTIMAANIQAWNASDHLTPADKQVIRFVYGT